MAKQYRSPEQVRKALRMGRKIRNVTVLDSRELSDGAFVNHDTVYEVRDGQIFVYEIEYQRMLDCSHIGKLSSIAAVCDACGRRVCEKCYFICHNCKMNICRYCVQSWGKGDEQVDLCPACHRQAKMKKAAKATSRGIFNFFVKREEEE